MNRNTSLQNGEWVTILTKKEQVFEKKKPFYISLRWILLGTYLIIGLVPLLLISSTLLYSMKGYFIEERKRELLGQANMISGQIISSDYLENDGGRDEMEETILEISQGNKYRILVLDASSVVVYDSGYEETGKTVVLPEVLEALQNKDIANEQENGSIYAAASIVDSDSTRMGVVLISDGIEDIEDILSEISSRSDTLLWGLAIGLLILMIVMSRIFTRPLLSMTKIIQRMSEGYFGERLQMNGRVHNEIVDLGIACNEMADQLDQVESTRQQFVSNVSHELKTPLSSVKVLSEAILLQEDVPKEMYVEFLHDINSEVDRMTAIINDLLTLVKLDQTEVPLNFAETSLNQLIQGIIKRMQPLAMVKDITIAYKESGEVLAQVDEVKLVLAVSNLIDNAIKYSSAEGKVEVTLEADHQNAFITVADSGIGIPEDEVGRIFDRFYRVDKTRDRETGGTGLGLSITHGTVRMHKGSIKVTSKEDEGTTIMVRIPLHQGQ
ncbi:HAMP domain-containing sensor histidine kinase [Chakrabartyella piscis]|uniref:sensor histidine kinase n=1 Tax=Chakrabartyella piscis TaxID=2918914 RepID=UPI0029584A2D|nr:HAMP domain-containing sensor histidine kinase [Chakrabartyella piscis]